MKNHVKCKMRSLARRIQPGMPVEFERWGGEQPLSGQVRVIEPVGSTKVSALGVEEQRVRVIVDITSPEKQWARLGTVTESSRGQSY